MKYLTEHPGLVKILKILLLAFSGALFFSWLIFTPSGLLGKADAIAYAVCHRIAARSFYIGDRQMPLCARCTGMYLGAMVGLLYQMRLGRRGGMPSTKIAIVLGFFFVAFGIDGVNSYLHFFPNAPSLYEPQNWLRLVTGTGLGIGMACVLLPVFNQTVWKDWSSERLLSSWRHFGAILAIAALLDLAVLTENPLFDYPLALLGPITVVVLLAMIYTIVWLMLAKRENSFLRFKELSWAFYGGVTTAILQIAIMDYARFLLTGTWSGFFS
jgi:uncharacterized membrane protein